MNRRIEYGDQFQRDFDAIWLSIAERDVDLADEVRDRIRVHIGEIAETPSMGHARHDVPAEYLSLPIKPWVLIYAFDSNRLKLVRLVHGARDFRRLF